MIIRKAGDDDIPAIHQLAHAIWWPTYSDFLSSEQIHFMLKDMYSEEALKQQFKDNSFLMVEKETIPVAFASFSSTDDDSKVYKLHKLYILPSEQGKGTGKKFIEYIAALIKSLGGEILELNVNRNNPALGFYKKQRFEIDHIADIPYHQFFLNDYVMRKRL